MNISWYNFSYSWIEITDKISSTGLGKNWAWPFNKTLISSSKAVFLGSLKTIALYWKSFLWTGITEMSAFAALFMDITSGSSINSKVLVLLVITSNKGYSLLILSKELSYLLPESSRPWTALSIKSWIFESKLLIVSFFKD